jgi:alpha-L-rhamnosidase
LDPREPAYRHIIFRPRPGGSLTWAEATLQTPFGQASIGWELEAGKLRLECEVPDTCRATLCPPAGYGANQLEYGAGRHSLTLEAI